MKFTLRQLQVFSMTAHEGTLTRAAASLAMSQSAASGALQELEQQFGLQLFDRVGKRLRLNEMGQSIRPDVEELLARAQQLEVALSQQTLAGEITVGATLTIGNYLIAQLVASYLERQASRQRDIRPAINIANTQNIVAQVLNFDLDLGLIEGEVHHPELEIIPWRDDELVVFCAPNHPLAKEKIVSDTQLAQARWIMRETGSGTRQTFERAMQGILPQLDIFLELQHSQGIKQAVKEGLGLGCLSRLAIEEGLAHQSLVELKVPHRHFKRKFYIVLHRKKFRSRNIKHWISVCLAQQTARAID